MAERFDREPSELAELMVEGMTLIHHRPRSLRLDRLMEIGVVCVGGTLMIAAWLADTAWFDRHFLPSFFTPRHQQLAIMTALRIAAASFGLAFIVVARPRLGRYARKRGAGDLLGTAFMLVCALVAAIISAELIMRTQTWHAAGWQTRKEPPWLYDPRLGWVLMPGHHGRDWFSGRSIDYLTDAHGYRVGTASEKINFGRPAIIFSGESVMEGYGLQWKDSIPAKVGARLGIQTANIAVNGYSTDQSFMRLRAELPRFRCPVAVVTIFMTSFLERNLNDDRPHLDLQLRWHPAQKPWRLEALGRHIFHYRAKRTIDEGIAMTSAVLSATARLAHSRGAMPLIIVPTFTPESVAEHALRKRILDDAGLNYLFVPIDPHWRLAGDMHPDGQATEVMAAAISRWLKSAKPDLYAETKAGVDKEGHRSCRDSSH